MAALNNQLRLEVLSGTTWTNLLSSSHRLSIKRGMEKDGVTDKPETGVLTATLTNPDFDPSTNPKVRPGATVRVTALTAGTWTEVFTGSLATIDTNYSGDKPVITITATDGWTDLDNKIVSTTINGSFRQRIEHVMFQSSVDALVTDTHTDIPTTKAISVTEDGTTLSQLMIIRNTNGAFVYLNKAGRIIAIEKASLPNTTPVVTFSDTRETGAAIYYNGVDTNFGSQALCNSVLIDMHNLDTDEGTKAFGPYDNLVSQFDWGNFSATVSVDDGVPSEIAADLLSIYALPRVFCNALSFNATKDISAAVNLELYQAARVKFKGANNLDAVYRVLSIEHEITPDSWDVNVEFRPLETPVPVDVTVPPAGSETGPTDLVPGGGRKINITVAALVAAQTQAQADLTAAQAAIITAQANAQTALDSSSQAIANANRANDLLNTKGKVWTQDTEPVPEVSYRWTGPSNRSSSEKLVDGVVVDTNLALNPSYEEDTYSWSPGNCVLSQEQVDGKTVLRGTMPETINGSTPYLISNLNVPSEFIGKEMNFQVKASWFADTKTSGAAIEFRVSDIDRNRLATYPILVYPGNEDFSLREVSGVIPEGTATIQPIMYWLGGVAGLVEGDYLQVDEWCISEGSVYFDGGTPSSVANDLWIDTSLDEDNVPLNTPKRWNGTAWVVVTDGAIEIAKSAAVTEAATDAQNKATTAKTAAISAAATAADSKVATAKAATLSQAATDAQTKATAAKQAAEDAAATYADAQISSTKTATLAAAATTAQTKADTAKAAAEAAAKVYADAQVSGASTATLTAAATDAQSKANIAKQAAIDAAATAADSKVAAAKAATLTQAATDAQTKATAAQTAATNAAATAADSKIATAKAATLTQAATDAQTKATAAQTAAIAAAATDATTKANAAKQAALDVANLKTETTYSTTADASGPGEAGDQWYRTSGGLVSGYWLHSGSGWVKQTLKGTVLAADAIDGKTVTGATIRTGTGTSRVEITPSGLVGYNNSVAKTTINAATGKISATDVDVTGTINATSGSISGILDLAGTGLIRTSASGARVQMGTTGIYAYNAQNQPSFALESATGDVSIVGTINATGGQFTGGMSITDTGGIYLKNSNDQVVSFYGLNRGNTITFPSADTIWWRGFTAYQDLGAAKGKCLFRMGTVISPPAGATSGQDIGVNFIDIGGTKQDGATADFTFIKGGKTYVDGDSSLTLTGNGADLRLSGGNSIVSNAIYSRTYGSAPNMYITGYGTLGRSTSSLRYKDPLGDFTLDNPKAALDLRPVQWHDKAQIERGKAGGYDDPEKRPVHTGFYAEEVEAIGGGMQAFVVHDEEGRPEALEEARLLGIALLELARNHEDRLNALEKETK